jgi:hypothetical protein
MDSSRLGVYFGGQTQMVVKMVVKPIANLSEEAHCQELPTRDHPVRLRAREFRGAGTRRGWCATGITFVGAEDNGVVLAH